jgi:hypothetical protein
MGFSLLCVIIMSTTRSLFISTRTQLHFILQFTGHYFDWSALDLILTALSDEVVLDWVHGLKSLE